MCDAAVAEFSSSSSFFFVVVVVKNSGSLSQVYIFIDFNS